MALITRRHRVKNLGAYWLFRFGSPKSRLKPQFIDTLDKAVDIMTKYLAQDLVHLSDGGFSPNRSSKLGFYHTERGFDVRPLVVMKHEAIPVELIVAPHLIPQPIKPMMMVSHASRIHLERDIGCTTYRLNGMEISSVTVSLVSRDFVNVECLGSLGYQRRELQCVSRLIRSSLNTRNNMGFDTAHKVNLNPILMAAFLAPLMVKPASISASREARGVNSEVSLYRLQRACALFYEGFEKRGKFRILQRTKAASKARRLGNQPIGLCFSKVSHEASAGHSAVDLIDSTENDIGQWESRSPEPVFRLWDTIAEVTEQDDELFLLMSLCSIVSSPFLSISYSDRLSLCNRAIGFSLSLDNELHSKDMLAFLMFSLKVSASAERLSVVKVHNIRSVARLGRDLPSQLILLHCVAVRYCQSSFLPYPHRSTPFVITLFCSYYSILFMYLSRVFRLIFVTFSSQSLLTRIYYLCYNGIQMNDVQSRIAELQEKGWTLAAIADEVELTVNAVQKWKAGDHSPNKATLAFLDQLLTRRRIPKKRRYHA
jgi:hypothetical protein